MNGSPDRPGSDQDARSRKPREAALSATRREDTARFAVVVLPIPPFWELIAITLVSRGLR
jgi:hypothetical protein